MTAPDWEREYHRVLGELVDLRDAIAACADACAIPPHVDHTKRLREIAGRYAETIRRAEAERQANAAIVAHQQETCEALTRRLRVVRAALEKERGREMVQGLLCRALALARGEELHDLDDLDHIDAAIEAGVLGDDGLPEGATNE